MRGCWHSCWQPGDGGLSPFAESGAVARRGHLQHSASAAPLYLLGQSVTLTSPPCPQIAGLPTMIFIGTDDTKPALRSEGLMTAETIKNILKKDLMVA